MTVTTVYLIDGVFYGNFDRLAKDVFDDFKLTLTYDEYCMKRKHFVENGVERYSVVFDSFNEDGDLLSIYEYNIELKEQEKLSFIQYLCVDSYSAIPNKTKDDFMKETDKYYGGFDTKPDVSYLEDGSIIMEPNVEDGDLMTFIYCEPTLLY